MGNKPTFLQNCRPKFDTLSLDFAIGNIIIENMLRLPVSLAMNLLSTFWRGEVRKLWYMSVRIASSSLNGRVRSFNAPVAAAAISGLPTRRSAAST